MIMKCKCKNEYQDKRYGREQRVHNPLKRDGTQPQRWRCTICENVRNSNANSDN